MKRNDWLLIAAAIIFSTLFYQQATGLNYLLFTFLVTSVIAFFNTENLKKWQWWYYAAIANISGFAVFYCNSNLSVLASVVSILVLSGKSFNYKNSIFINLSFSFFSIISSIVFVVIDYVKFKKQTPLNEDKKNRKVYFGIFVALIIAIVFFALYQQANPLFKEFTKNINLSWISIGWCLFTVWGFLVIYGLVYYRQLDQLTNLDINANKTITNIIDESEKQITNNTVIALALFGLLNMMLVFVNALDITNLLGSHELPKGVLLSDFVHNAVWSLVFSIVIAVGLIMWFFKGDLNFNKQSKTLKYLVYFWILQSAIMVISAMVRNSWYVAEYQLSYLRIGVYVFLSLSLVGLFFTFLKICQTKSAWYLVRQNFETWFLILGLCSLINWDKLISDYNISNAKSMKALDKTYLISLSNANLPELTEIIFANTQDSLFRKNTNTWTNYDLSKLSSKIYEAVCDQKNETWQSFNLRDNAINSKMQKLIDSKIISGLALNYKYDVQLKNLTDFQYIRFLDLGNVPNDFERIAFFTKLEELAVGNLSRASIKNILHNAELKRLQITNYFNDDNTLEHLKQLKKLEVICVPTISNEGLLKLNHHPSLQVVEVKTLYQDQIEFIHENNLSFKVKEVYYGDR
jgi:hypothetical protein